MVKLDEGAIAAARKAYREIIKKDPAEMSSAERRAEHEAVLDLICAHIPINEHRPTRTHSDGRTDTERRNRQDTDLKG
ncbi:hypothetical protein SAMN05444007_108217 [Cribrihabitans marinus]|uniref:Uncharacterized protein n=1 Tax=Cribrihabitans marinus TaxID=1227549 RepID=A0A1H7CNE3_9RHOB|nr:hypothetical protein GCM10010973_29850 [Cribrihabitans marinus]SEJ90986.1 hypothetical protein SAMN05444007_108217 [Cribrihabitans marinus]